MTTGKTEGIHPAVNIDGPRKMQASLQYRNGRQGKAQTTQPIQSLVPMTSPQLIGQHGPHHAENDGTIAQRTQPYHDVIGNRITQSL